MFDLIIRNAQLVTPDAVLAADLAAVDGKIVEITPSINDATAVVEIDAAGCMVYPGLIDPHVHFNEPGRTDWEGISTGSAALVSGGGTCFFDMPLNSKPALLTPADFAAKDALMAAKSHADYALWGGLTPDNLEQLEALADCGVIGFKAFMSGSGIDDFGRVDEDTLAAGMKIAAARGLIVAVHAEDEQTCADLQLKAQRNSHPADWLEYVSTRPIRAERKAIEAACGLAAQTGCKLHIVHVSSSIGVLEVLKARRAGADVTCETCPHYFMFTEDDLFARGALLKCAPPLRPLAITDGLWSRVVEGKVDWLASDHSPAPPSMKMGADAFAIWGGISGVQSTLTSALTRQPTLKPTQVAALCAGNAAQRFGLSRKGRIEIGYDADLTIVDPQHPFTLRKDDLLDRHKQSPYVGTKFKQRPVRTILRGRTISENGVVLCQPSGQRVR